MKEEKTVNPVENKLGRKYPIMKYLIDGTLSIDKLEAWCLRYQTPYYTLIDWMLYKMGFFFPFIFLDDIEAN